MRDTDTPQSRDDLKALVLGLIHEAMGRPDPGPGAEAAGVAGAVEATDRANQAAARLEAALHGAEGLLGELHAAGEALDQRAAQMEAQASAAAHRIEAAQQQAEQRLAHLAAELEGHIQDRVEGARQTLGAELHSLQRELQDGASRERELLSSQLREGEEQARARLEGGLHQALDRVEQRLEAGRGSLSNLKDELLDRIRERQGDVQRDLHRELQDELGRGREQLHDERDRLRGSHLRLRSAIEDVVSEIVSRVPEVGPVLSRLAQHIDPEH